MRDLHKQKLSSPMRNYTMNSAQECVAPEWSTKQYLYASEDSSCYVHCDMFFLNF